MTLYGFGLRIDGDTSHDPKGNCSALGLRNSVSILFLVSPVPHPYMVSVLSSLIFTWSLTVSTMIPSHIYEM